MEFFGERNGLKPGLQRFEIELRWSFWGRKLNSLTGWTVEDAETRDMVVEE
jgi:hypothetical protein